MANVDNTQDDATLVALVLTGDHEAFAMLLQRYAQSVLHLCQRMLRSPMEAQDVAQEAALQAFLGLPRLEDPHRFGAWLHAIAANLARMALRRHRPLSLDALSEETSLAIYWMRTGKGPEEVTIARELHDAIIAALQELSPPNRDVVIGFFMDGYSYAELALLLNVPVSTIRGRLSHSRRKLRQTLRPFVQESLARHSILSQGRIKETQMEQPTLVEVEISMRPFGYVRPLALSTDALLLLTERGTSRKLALPVQPEELSSIQGALGQGQEAMGQESGTVFHVPSPSLTADLPLRLLTSLGTRVERVVVHKLVENTFYATITLLQDECRIEMDIRPSEALALAIGSSAPIYVTRALLDEIGFDEEEWNGTPERQDLFKQRMWQRVEQAETAYPPPRLSEEVRQNIDDCLARLLAHAGGDIAMLMHQSGTLVASRGGNTSVLRHYTKALSAQDTSPRNLAELLRYEKILMDELFPVDTNLLFFFVRPGWRLQFAEESGKTKFVRDPFPHAMEALHELNYILPPGSPSA